MIALFCSALFVGYKFSMKYKRRHMFFQSLVMLCHKFDIEMNFSKERIANIIKNLDEKTIKHLYGLEKNYLSFLNQENDLNKELLFQNIAFIRPAEQDLIYSFFKSLGRSDLDSQSKEIHTHLARFDNLEKETALENKKYGSLSIKLGVVAGLFLLILLI